MSDNRGILPLSATDPGGQAAYSRVYDTPWARPSRPEPPASSYFGGGITLDPPPQARPQPPSQIGGPSPQAGGAADLMVPSLHGANWTDEALSFRTAVSGMLQDIQTNHPDLTGQFWIEGPKGGFRTYQDQVSLQGIPGRVAKPGESLHEQGLAADWAFKSPDARQKFVDIASRHGLVFPFDDDTGHMQLAANAGNPRLAAMVATDRSGMWNIMQRVESSNGTDLKQTKTPDGDLAQGINQITTKTWKDFAPSAGVSLDKYPTAQAVVDDPNLTPEQKVAVQNQVAAVIPLSRWKGPTLEAIKAQYGNVDESKTFGELAGGVPKGQITAGGTDYGKAAFEARNQGIERIQEGLNALIKKMNETDPAEPEMRDLLRQHREFSQQLEQAYLDKAFHAPERTQSDIMSQFGSLAMMAAVFGGFAARVPAVASLNAAGAVMEAQAANNDRDYQDRLGVWKTQVGALQNAITMEHNQIQDIMSDRNTTLREKHDKLNETYQVLGLERDLANLRAGSYEALQKDQDQRYKMAKDLLEIPKTQAEIEYKKAETDKLKAETAAIGDLNNWAPELRGNDDLGRKARNYIKAKHDDLVAKHEGAIKQAAAEGKDPPVDPPPSLAEMQQDNREAREALQAVGRGASSSGIPGLGNTEIDRAAADIIEGGAATENIPVADYLAKHPGVVGQARRDAARQMAIARNPYAQERLDERAQAVVTELDEMDRLVNLIKKSYFTVGLGGRVTRPVESLSNVLHLSDSTLRRDIESAIALVRMTAYRALSPGARSNAQDRALLDRVVRGLSMGDTTQNTISSIRALQAFVKESSAPLLRASQYGPRLDELPPPDDTLPELPINTGGSETGATGATPAPAATPNAPPPWANDPVVH